MLLSFCTFVEAQEKKSFSFSKKSPPLHISAKKRRFYDLLVLPTQKTYNTLQKRYLHIKEELLLGSETGEIVKLKTLYKVKSDRALLLALKPHPVSITLAQAAMESAWGTSRFFREANNVFGMWSKNPKDKRIAAGEKRGGKRTIWLRKFDTIEESIWEYYKTIGRAKAYKKLREYRYESDDVYKIVKGLDKYSELGQEYVDTIATLIWHNDLTQYDIKESKNEID